MRIYEVKKPIWYRFDIALMIWRKFDESIGR